MAGGKRLYDALGLAPTATESEIKKAYHRKALTCHPDKVGKEGEAEFKKISEAYAVLSDAQKRAVYDDYGDKGLEYMNNGVADPLMQTLGTGAVILFAAVFAFFTCFCAITAVACVASKADGNHEGWSWGTTLWALWLWEAAVLLPLGLAAWAIIRNLVRGPDAKPRVDDATADDRPSSAPPRKESLKHLALLLWAMLYFIFTILLAHSLDRRRDGKSHLKWIQVAAPLLVAEAARTVLELIAVNPGPWLKENEMPEFSLVDVAVLLLGRLWGALYRPLTVLLVALRADGTIDSPWGAAFAPAMLHLVINLVSAFVVNRLRVRNGHMEGENLCKQTAADALNTLMIMITLGLLGAKLQGSASYSYGVALIPLFIQLAWLTLMSCVLVAVAGAVVAGQAQELRSAADDDDGGESHVDGTDGRQEPDGDYTRLDSAAPTPAHRQQQNNASKHANDAGAPSPNSAHTTGYGGIDATLD